MKFFAYYGTVVFYYYLFKYRKIVFATLDLLVGHFYLICLKRRTTEKTSETYHSRWPYIHLIGMANWALNDLRCNIIGGTAHCSLLFIGELQLCSQSKISHLHLHILTQEDIPQFQIPMYDSIRMHILNSWYQLVHEISCFFGS